MKWILLFILLLHSAQLWAAACCGGSSTSPSIITGDDQAQISASLAYAQVIGDAPVSGLPVFRGDGNSEEIQTLRLAGAALLSDRWQIGAQLPISRRSHATQGLDRSSWGLADVDLDVGFEALPELEYSVWKPRGFVFAHAIFPTGQSIYESTDALATDTSGRGFFSPGAGALFVKSWGIWDGTFLFEAHHGIARSFGTLHVTPGWGGTLGLNAGVSPGMGPWRFGLGLSPLYEEGLHLSGDSSGDSASQLVWNATAQVSWMIRSDLSSSLVYLDQTLMGPAQNTSLNRAVSLQIEKRWER
jgi:hypothetical protein